MKRKLPETECQLLVIGTGMAGMSATLFAAARGIDTIQVGMTGELNFASGLLDLMAVHPIAQGRVWHNPWQAIDTLVRDCPKHPYGLLDRRDLRAAFLEFTEFLGGKGLPYHLEPDRNQQLVTPMGTIKTSYAVPATVVNGVRALRDRAPCLIVGFDGLKGFSSRQITESLQHAWPALRSCRLPFPTLTGELYPEHMAHALAFPGTREQLAAAVRPHLGQAAYIGMPSVLGIYDHGTVFEDLQDRLGRPLFEIPTMPPAVTGLRLKSLFEHELPRLGARCHFQQKVLTIEPGSGAGFRFGVGTSKVEWYARSRGAILATGRFFGKGLVAERTGISESLFDLPVTQPEHRTDWHRLDFLDPSGHPVNRAGLETDRLLRPLNRHGHPAYPTLHAAGSILAHQDWMRMKCGSGLAITTAYAAVKAFARSLP